jgi:hypothetical protein
VPGSGLVIEGVISQAAVEDADQPVGEGAEGLVVGGGRHTEPTATTSLDITPSCRSASASDWRLSRRLSVLPESVAAIPSVQWRAAPDLGARDGTKQHSCLPSGELESGREGRLLGRVLQRLSDRGEQAGL